MDVTPGTRLGPYEIVSRLGAGGMGEVFRARDTRLDRSVAIKVIPGELSRNAQLKVRFEREAKAISQLNHPHICTLYDVGDDYLVMELLEGETLADRIARGPLPLADVLKFGAQIADALDRAHRAGIVHRDLKPGNVMLTKAGAKLLDFGLAKTAAAPINPDGPTVQQDQSLTQEGTILGTFQYMAPEQLEAEDADPRTDIFALGAVLYEMATGRRAFQGKTKTSLIAAIVGGQPQPVSQLIPLSPPALDHVIQKCLEKEREDRWQSAHDVAEELKWIATIPPEPKLRGGRVTKIAVAAVTALWLRARSAPKPRTAFAILPPKGMSFMRPFVSPDGTMVAFATEGPNNEGGLWVRRLDEVEAKRLTTAYDDYMVAWSPDSKWIAYATRRDAERHLMKIPVAGGTPEPLWTRHVRTAQASWAADGTLLVNNGVREPIFALRPGASELVPVTTFDPKRRESFHASPTFLSDGRRFLYVVHTVAEQQNEVWAGSTDGKLRKLLFRIDALVGLAQGRLYFVRDGAMFAQPFDEDALQLEGEPRRVATRVFFAEEEAAAAASVAATGAIVYRPVSVRTVELAWYDRSGRRLENVWTAPGLYPTSVSDDGSRVAARRFDPAKGADDVYVLDVVRGIETRLTRGRANHHPPVISPDGTRVYYSSDRDGLYDVYAQAEDGATPPVTIWKSDTDKTVVDISPDGKTLLVREELPATRADIWLVPIDAPEKRVALAATEAQEGNAAFSPDGKWVVYLSDRTGREEAYVRHVGGGRTVRISTEGATGCAWARDASALFVRYPTNDRWLVPLTVAGNEVVPGKATLMFTAPAPSYSIVAEQDKGLLMSVVPDPADYVSVMHYDSAP